MLPFSKPVLGIPRFWKNTHLCRYLRYLSNKEIAICLVLKELSKWKQHLFLVCLTTDLKNLLPWKHWRIRKLIQLKHQHVKPTIWIVIVWIGGISTFCWMFGSEFHLTYICILLYFFTDRWIKNYWNLWINNEYPLITTWLEVCTVKILS